MTLHTTLQHMGLSAREAAHALALTEAHTKTKALHAMAAAIAAQQTAILEANARDMHAAGNLSPAARDRLMLNETRVAAMATCLATIADLPDPVGVVLKAWDVAHNGLHIQQVSVPLGVIGIIYEARPNVTAEAAALCVKSGNASLLRCGSECLATSQAIVAAMHEGLRQAGVTTNAIQLVPTADREAVGLMLTMHEHIDIIVPRGGASLTARVQAESRIPTIQHLVGNCHTYIHAAADPAKAVAITHNAKLRRTGVCGATESLLIDAAALSTLGVAVLRDLLDSGCEVRGDAAACTLDGRMVPAGDDDWGTEYLAPIISVKTVRDVQEAIAHINRYGSHHTDAILTEDARAAELFCRGVDSAIVLVNASTQFADGGEFGFGGEIGISTGKLHARGPVGAAQLVTYKYIVTTSNALGACRA